LTQNAAREDSLFLRAELIKIFESLVKDTTRVNGRGL
jgi:hypothetical protein